MSRGAIALAITSTAIGGLILTGRHDRHASPTAPTSSPVVSRASRGVVREPLPHVRRATHRPPRARRHLRVSAPAARIADVTQYCWTGNRNAAGRWPQRGDVAVLDRSIRFGSRIQINGNVYVVRDWVGYGTDFDIYAGRGATCESHALQFGRQHLQVVVDR